MKYFLFYGTLRAQGPDIKKYNFDRFGHNSQKYLSTVKLKNWKLLHLRYFPCIIEGDENDEIVAELDKPDEWEEDTPTIEEMINLMCDLPEWAKGCPINAEGFVTERYRK